MLNKFSEWANQLTIRLNKRNIVAQITKSDFSDNPSVRLDMDSPTAIARITCWESGDYDAEVIHIETEKTIFSSRGNLQNEPDFSNVFSLFFKSLDN